MIPEYTVQIAPNVWASKRSVEGQAAIRAGATASNPPVSYLSTPTVSTVGGASAGGGGTTTVPMYHYTTYQGQTGYWTPQGFTSPAGAVSFVGGVPEDVISATDTRTLAGSALSILRANPDTTLDPNVAARLSVGEGAYQFLMLAAEQEAIWKRGEIPEVSKVYSVSGSVSPTGSPQTDIATMNVQYDEIERAYMLGQYRGLETALANWGSVTPTVRGDFERVSPSELVTKGKPEEEKGFDISVYATTKNVVSGGSAVVGIAMLAVMPILAIPLLLFALINHIFGVVQ